MPATTTVSESGTLGVPEFQWSDLSRRAVEVGQALDDFGEVRVRRGSRSYQMALSDDQIAHVLRDLCRLLSAVVATESDEHTRAILNAAWPWTRALPTDDQVALAHEVGPLAEMCESLDTWKPLLDSIAAWQGTARAWASGAVPTSVRKPLGSPVARP